MPKNLILSYATNTKIDDLAVFIRSARRFCSADTVDIVVVTNPMSAEHADLAERNDVELYPAYSIWQEIRGSTQMRAFYRIILALSEFFRRHPRVFGDQGTLDQVNRIISHPWIYAQAQRFLVFEDLLKVRCTYQMILLSDARDVAFQSNPFEGLCANALHVALQVPTESYGLDNVDSNWMTDVLGPGVLKMLLGKPSSCCGTIMGGHRVIMDYLSKLNCMIIQNKRNPVEQPMHNKIIYLDLPADSVILHENAIGPFITLGGMSASELELVDGQLYARGRLIPVVHMYDRIPETRALFAKLYADRITTL